MKIGLCGASNISKTYIKCFKKLGHDIEIVYGNDLKILKNFAELNSIPNYTNNIENLVGDDKIESYLVANDPSKHLDIAEILVKAGKNVLIEKPIDISIDKIENFYQLTKNKKNIIHVVNQNRFDPFYINIKKKLERQIKISKNTKFANLTMFFYRDNKYFNHPNKWKKKYSCPLINQGIHFLDLMMWFFGDFLDVTSLSQKDNKELKLHDNIVGSVKFENNILLNIFASTSIKRNEVNFEFFCEDQIINFNKNNSSSKLKTLLTFSKSQFDLFSNQCELFIKSIESQDTEKNNILEAYNAVRLSKRLNNSKN